MRLLISCAENFGNLDLFKVLGSPYHRAKLCSMSEPRPLGSGRPSRSNLRPPLRSSHVA
jgi:hypothetical protein